MRKVIHKAETRGVSDYIWLYSRHTFSFGEYYNSDRVRFGKLRVLNDDIVEAAAGFSTHAHENMEIISIPLAGSLLHKDSMGNEFVIESGEVQIMSAGSGIKHSEYNNSKTEPVNFLQIWVLPKEKNIEPRYDQIKYDIEKAKNSFLEIVSPDKDSKDSVWINQEAYFNLSYLEEGFEVRYEAKLERPALYVFILSGEIEIDGEVLRERDGIGITEFSEVVIKGTEESKILLIETKL